MSRGNKQAIMCNQTGQIFESGTAAARWLWGETEDDVEFSSIQVRLYRHLSGYGVNGTLKDGTITKWYCKDIYGYTFKKVGEIVRKEAKDLFKELGYKECKPIRENTAVSYSNLSTETPSPYYVSIEFWNNTYVVESKYSMDSSPLGAVTINKSLHKAIVKQLKELEWI